jgi:tetratricopeptide (TPR) repeat protein
VSSTQVADIVKRQLADKQRDEIELIADYIHLQPDQAMRLRRRAIAQKAARSFALERADFVVEDHITVRFVPGSELDIRSVIYLGARQFLSEARLNGELGQLGQWFQLKPELAEYLPQFGFGEAEQPVLEALARGAGLGEIEQPEVEQRMARAVVYALVSCGQCNVEAGMRAAPKKAPTPRPQSITQTPRPMSGNTQAPPRSRSDTLNQPTFRRSDTEADARTAAPTDRRRTSSRQPQPRRNATPTAMTNEVELLIKQRLAILDTGGDHYALLGIAREASASHVQKAYFALARQLHPDRLSALGIVDETRQAQRLFAQVNTAFAVLGDVKKREAYLDVLDRGGEQAVRAEQQAAEELTERVLESEEAFRKGEAALRRDQIPLAIKELERAVALNGDESDYQAMLAWARFCAAPDKMSVAQTTKRALRSAIDKSPPSSVTGRFYLGRVERMLGRDKEALELFEEVLEVSPGHSEATAEVRVLQARIGGDKGGGLFGRLKR